MILEVFEGLISKLAVKAIYEGIRDIVQGDPFQKAFDKSLRRLLESKKISTSEYNLIFRDSKRLYERSEIVSRKDFMDSLSAELKRDGKPDEELAKLRKILEDLYEDISKEHKKIILSEARKNNEIFSDRVVSNLQSYGLKDGEILNEIKNISNQIKIADDKLEEIYKRFGKLICYKLPNDLYKIVKHLTINPADIGEYVEIEDLRNTDLSSHIYILGQPGAGKSTSIYKLLEKIGSGKVVLLKGFREIDIHNLFNLEFKDLILVWDDIHENPALFRDVFYKLLTSDKEFLLLCSARLSEKGRIDEKIGPSFWNKNFKHRNIVTLRRFDEKKMKELIHKCRTIWKIKMDKNAVEELIKKNMQSDGTPLYIVSVLIEHIGKELKYNEVKKLPRRVTGIWKRYMPKDTSELSVLYCLKFLRMIEVPPFKTIINAFSEEIFGIKNVDVVIDSLIHKFWIRDTGEYFVSLDTQLAVIEFRIDTFIKFVKYIEKKQLSDYYNATLLFGLSSYLYERVKYAKSDEEVRIPMIKAIQYIEEAIKIRRKLGLEAVLAMSLNNASNRYSDMASLSKTEKEQRENLDKAIQYVEEAIEIRRNLGIWQNLAKSLAISVFVYENFQTFDSEYFGKSLKNCDEAIDIFVELGQIRLAEPLIPISIQKHEIMFDLTKDDKHRQRTEYLKTLL